VPVRTGAQTPEELEMLLEDAFVVRDRKALTALFEDGAVLGAGRCEARGDEAIAGLAEALWKRGLTYLADPRRVLQTRDRALVVAACGNNVLHRGEDGAWRYSISLLTFDTHSKENR
jgi:hypothetical protein